MNTAQIGRLVRGLGRRVLPFMFFLILVLTTCTISATFADLVFQRQWILQVLARIQSHLMGGHTLIDGNGALQPIAQAFVLQLQTLSERGLDLNAIEFLFGFISIAIVTVSVFLLEKSHENVVAAEEQVNVIARRVSDLEVSAKEIAVTQAQVATASERVSQLEQSMARVEKAELNLKAIEIRTAQIGTLLRNTAERLSPRKSSILGVPICVSCGLGSE